MNEELLICKQSFCQHCRELEPFTATIIVRDTTLCVPCAMNKGIIDDVDVKHIRLIEINSQIFQYEKEIAMLKKEMTEIEIQLNMPEK